MTLLYNVEVVNYVSITYEDYRHEHHTTKCKSVCQRMYTCIQYMRVQRGRFLFQIAGMAPVIKGIAGQDKQQIPGRRESISIPKAHPPYLTI